MKNHVFYTLIFTLLSFYACGTSTTTTSKKPPIDPHAQMHQDFIKEEKQKEILQNYAKDISGTYTGLIPCADCENISYKIQLNKDFTYVLKYTYNGKSKAKIVKSGTYYFIKDRLLIQLDNQANGMNYLQKQPYGLLLLDENGKEITGVLASRYKLRPLENQKNTETSGMKKILLKKWQKGIDFYAFGNEPFWSLDLDIEKSIHLKNLDGLNLNTPIISIDSNNLKYRSKLDSIEVIVELNHSKCVDNMSGEKYNYIVNVDYKLNSKKEFSSYLGCGKYVPNPRLNDLWTIIKVDNLIIDPNKFNENAPYFELNTSHESILGTDGCNSFRGNIEISLNKIIVGNLASSLMACQNMEISSKITKFLSGKSLIYTIENNQLSLFDKDKKVMILKHID